MGTEINIIENQQISVDDELYCKFYEAKLIDPSLPFRLLDKTLIIDEYIVGSIQVGDITLKIQPRNKAFNLNNLFEMVIYTDFSFLKEEEITGFGFSNGFGIAVDVLAADRGHTRLDQKGG